MSRATASCSGLRLAGAGLALGAWGAAQATAAGLAILIGGTLRDLVSPNGSLYLEAPRVWADAELAELGWQVLRQGRAGQVAFHLLGPQPAGG